MPDRWRSKERNDTIDRVEKCNFQHVVYISLDSVKITRGDGTISLLLRKTKSHLDRILVQYASEFAVSRWADHPTQASFHSTHTSLSLMSSMVIRRDIPTTTSVQGHNQQIVSLGAHRARSGGIRRIVTELSHRPRAVVFGSFSPGFAPCCHHAQRPNSSGVLRLRCCLRQRLVLTVVVWCLRELEGHCCYPSSAVSISEHPEYRSLVAGRIDG